MSRIRISIPAPYNSLTCSSPSSTINPLLKIGDLVLDDEYYSEEKLHHSSSRHMEPFSVNKLPRKGTQMVDYGDQLGRKLGQYRILQPIGQGGLADVFVAEHADTTTKVA